jgi:hypothetical protein
MCFPYRPYNRPRRLESSTTNHSALAGMALFPHCVSAISRAWQGDIR